MTVRYALYYAPDSSHPLWRAGSDWLGRDAAMAQASNGLHWSIPDFDRLTAAPRRYGFHATIKAPFALTPGITAQDLSVALARYAGAQRPFRLPPLEVARLDDFLALIPSSPEPELSRVEREVVTQFDAFRAATTDVESNQRRYAGLDAGQENLLRRWGYPHVLERFRFHMSLSGSLSEVDEDTCANAVAAARAHFASALAVPLNFDALCIFEEAEHGADFALQRRVAFGMP